jgi:hypothetical protein
MAIASVILLIISGIAGVVLTVWGRVMPPESRGAKRGFVVVGGLSVICIVAAGIVNALSQTQLNQTISTMADDVRKLAAPAKVEQNASVDQILGAAAAKLIQQDEEIKKLTADVKGITKPADGLYLNGTMVGRALGEVQQTVDGVTFQLVVSGSDGLDFSQILEYQSLRLKCEAPGVIGQTGSFGVMDTRYPSLHCTIIR